MGTSGSPRGTPGSPRGDPKTDSGMGNPPSRLLGLGNGIQEFASNSLKMNDFFEEIVIDVLVVIFVISGVDFPP